MEEGNLRYEKMTKPAAFAACMMMAANLSAASLPPQLSGSWKITKILPTHNTSCWTADRAQPLVGSMLSYSNRSMRWQGGSVPLQGVATREVTEEQFRKENTGENGFADFAQIGIHAASVIEVDLQHDDADITGATTEVPGDSILLAGPNRIVVSACGIYFEAIRPAPRT
jgi:hypothetical protein